MKKNLFPLISICLTVLLLVVCIQQNNALKEYKAQIDEELESLRSELNIQMDNLSIRVDELTLEGPFGVQEEPSVLPGYSVSEFSVTPYDVNVEEWMLETYASATLTETDEDMVVTLLAAYNGETVSVPMSRSNSYIFDANLKLPIDNYNEAVYTIQVEMNGKITRQEVYTFADVYDVMPIHCGGTSLSVPDYENGQISGQCGLFVDKYAGVPSPLPLLDPHFDIIKNGVVVQTLEAMHTGQWEEGIAWPYYPVDWKFWSADVQEGDRIDIRFRCHNEDGLGWEFYFASYEIRDGQVQDLEMEPQYPYGFYRP